jgi:hypothetical protein
VIQSGLIPLTFVAVTFPPPRFLVAKYRTGAKARNAMVKIDDDAKSLIAGVKRDWFLNLVVDY